MPEVSEPNSHSEALAPVKALPGWKTQGLAVLSGLLLIGAFPSLDWGWLAWFALVPFFLTFPHRSLRTAIKHGITLGFVYFGGLLTWLAIFAGHAIGHILGTIAQRRRAATRRLPERSVPRSTTAKVRPS